MGYCEWASSSSMMQRYHDQEWGMPVHDDQRMFEHLCMESLQCGLSWALVLKRREVFRACFANFDFDAMAAFDEGDVERILATEGMLRSRRKVEALINNARRYQEVRREFGSFCNYLWAFTDGRTLVYEGHPQGNVPASNELSERIARDLKRRGFTYVGGVTVYSHLQACGLINDHACDCPRFEEINRKHPVTFVGATSTGSAQ